MDKKIVLVGAGSTSFGPATIGDLFLSDILKGSTVILHDINKEKLEIMYELCIKENEIKNNWFNIERTINRKDAFKNADFIISSIEVGDRFNLWRQDYEIPRKYGSTQILGECGGPGGTFHAFRIIPPVIDIVKDADKICPNAFFINFSNPMSRVCLAIKRTVKEMKFIGLCHQIGFMERHLPQMFHDLLFRDGVKKPKTKDKLEQGKKFATILKMTVAGLNHFGFLMGLEDKRTGDNLMPEFHKRALNYFTKHLNRWEFSTLTLEVYKRFGYWPYTGDNHLGEYLQFGEEFTETQDMIDWINRTEDHGMVIYKRIKKYHDRLKKGRYSKKGHLVRQPSGERAIPIIESIVTNKSSYETAVNIPNEGIIDNLPQDLIIEVPINADANGIHRIKLGNIPKSIAALLRIEASVQDVCIDAILKKSKEQAIIALAIDPNVGSFENAEHMFNEMRTLQKDYLSYFA